MTDAERLREIARKNQLQIDAANEQFGPKRAGFSEFCDDTRAMFAIADRLEKREAFTKAAEEYVPWNWTEAQIVAFSEFREKAVMPVANILAAYRAMKEAEHD